MICQLSKIMTTRLITKICHKVRKGTFYAIKGETTYPFYNDADEEFQDKLRLDYDLNKVEIGHWKSYDDSVEYYSKVCHKFLQPSWS